MKDQPVDSRS